MQSQKTTQNLIIPKNTAYGLGIILTFMGASHYGVAGVAYAAIAASAFHLAWIIILFEKKSRLYQ